MKSSTLAVVLLAGLNVAFLLDEYCVIDWIGKDCGTIVPVDVCACDDKERYRNEKEGGGSQIPVVDSRRYLENFQRRYPMPYKGAFISKRVLDDIFCSDKTANGVYCYFGMTDDRPESFVLLVEQGTTENTLIRKSTFEGPSAFMGQLLCPNMCGATGQSE